MTGKTVSKIMDCKLQTELLATKYATGWVSIIAYMYFVTSNLPFLNAAYMETKSNNVFAYWNTCPILCLMN